MLPEITLSLDFTVTILFTVLFVNVVFLAVVPKVTAPFTVLLSATMFAPLMSNTPITLPVNTELALAVILPWTLLFSAIPLEETPKVAVPIKVLFLYMLFPLAWPYDVVIPVPLWIRVLFSTKFPAPIIAIP